LGKGGREGRGLAAGDEEGTRGELEGREAERETGLPSRELTLEGLAAPPFTLIS